MKKRIRPHIMCGVGDVKSVVIDGKLVMENRKVFTLDEDEIVRMAQERAERVMHKAGVRVKRKWPVI